MDFNNKRLLEYGHEEIDSSVPIDYVTTMSETY